MANRLMLLTRSVIAIALCHVLALPSAASTVSLVPTTPTEGAVGDTVTLDIVIDFSDVPNGTLGGGFAVSYDPLALAVTYILPYNVTGGIPFALGPQTVTDGLLDDWINVGNPSGLAADGPLRVATIDFQILSGLSLGNSTTIQISETSGPSGPWISALDYTTVLYPEYNQISVTRVPLPASMWTLLSGVGLLSVFREKRRRLGSRS